MAFLFGWSKILYQKKSCFEENIESFNFYIFLNFAKIN